MVLTENSFEIASIFLSDVFQLRVLIKYTDDLIGNMDETPTNTNMSPNY